MTTATKKYTVTDGNDVQTITATDAKEAAKKYLAMSDEPLAHGYITVTDAAGKSVDYIPARIA